MKTPHFARRFTTQATVAALLVFTSRTVAQVTPSPSLDALTSLPSPLGIPQPLPQTQELVESSLANADLKAALIHFQAGEFPQAIAKASAVTAVDPRSFTAYQMIGASRLKLNDFEGGIDALQKASELNPESIGTLATLGNAFLAHGDLAKARKYFDLILQKRPDHPTGFEGLGLVSEREAKFDEAITHFEARVKSIPATQLGAKVNLAALYNRQGQFNKTITLLSAAPNLAPINSSALELLAIAHLGLGRPAEAVKLYTLAYTTAPSAQLAFGLGIAHRQLNQFAESLRYLKEATTDRANWGPAWVQLAETQIASTDYTGALTSLEKARSFSPEKRAIETRIGDVQFLAKDYSNAVTSFEALVASAKEPDLALYDRLGSAYQAKGDVTSAERILKDAATKFPQSALPSYRLGSLYGAQERFKDAIPHYLTAATIEPDNLIFQTTLSDAYRKTGDNRKAVEVADRLLQRQPASIDARVFLATAYSQTGDERRAAETYKEVIKRKPDQILALNNLAMIHARAGEFDEALRLSQRAVELVPRSGQLLDTFGWIKYLKGDFTGALPLLKKSAELSPEDPSILYHLGMAHAKKNEKADALKAFKSAISLSKVFTEYQQTQEMIASLGGRS